MIPVAVWLSVKHETRLLISRLFNIPKSSFVEVSNNKVISDGHSQGDLALITVERLQSELGGEETDIFVLFNKLILKLETTVEVVDEPKKDEPKEIVRESVPEVSSPAEAGTIEKRNPSKGGSSKVKSNRKG